MDKDSFSKSYPDVTGVMLAGGKSRRMGRDKAALAIDGKTIANRALDFLQALFPFTLIAGDRPDLVRSGVTYFPDIFTGSSLGGLHNGLSNATTDWIFALPCDMPWPDIELAAHLLTCRTGVAAVVPRTRSGFEPLFAAYHKDCLPHLEGMLERQNYRISDFFERIPVHYVDPGQVSNCWQRSLANLNTPEDLDRILRERS